MRKYILIYGSVLGALLCINMIYMVDQLYNTPNFESNDTLGYIILFSIFSLVFFGIWDYRKKAIYVSIWKALKLGVLISLLASTIYVVVWLFYYYLFVPDFMDVYISQVIKETPKEEIITKTLQMEEFKNMYQNPFFVIVTTYSEVFPLGLLVSLISALLLKKKNLQEN